MLKNEPKKHVPRLHIMKKTEKRQILVDHYFDFYLMAVAMLKDDQDAKDAVQDAVVNTMVHHNVKDPYFYCRQTLKNKCIDMLKHNSRLNKIDEWMLVSDPEHEEQLSVLRKVKNELSFLDRAVIELHYEENYTVDDIAQKVGISVAKTKRIIAKTKDYLKKRMEEEL